MNLLSLVVCLLWLSITIVEADAQPDETVGRKKPLMRSEADVKRHEKAENVDRPPALAPAARPPWRSPTAAAADRPADRPIPQKTSFGEV